VSDTQAYKQFGNSVAVPVVERVLRHMLPHLLTLIPPVATIRGELPLSGAAQPVHG
jgi:DNA (cytosine-5)-methyltransferase 1